LIVIFSSKESNFNIEVNLVKLEKQIEFEIRFNRRQVKGDISNLLYFLFFDRQAKQHFTPRVNFLELRKF